MNDTEALKLAFCKCKGMVIQLSPRILQVYFYDNHGTKYGDIFTAITILKSLIIMSLTEITLPIIHQPSMRLMHLMPFMTSWMTNPLSSRPVKVSSYITPKRILYPASHNLWVIKLYLKNLSEVQFGVLVAIMVLGIPANLLILLIAHYMKNNNSFYSWFMYNITMCDLVILIYTTVKLMYIRFGEDFTGWLPNDWFGSLICKGMISIKIDQSLSFLIYMLLYFLLKSSKHTWEQTRFVW